MGTKPPIPLEFDVEPGTTAELSLNMVASIGLGCVQGSWMLQDGQGNRFGIGPNQKNSFWVVLEVWWDSIPKVTFLSRR